MNIPTPGALRASFPKTARAAALLGGLVVLLGVLGAIDDAVTDAQLFDIEGELKDGPNLLVIASGGVLFVAAALAWNLARQETDPIGSPAPWYAIGGLFAFMGVDELTMIHEHLDAMTGIAWQLLYLPVVLVGAAAWAVLLRRLRAADSRIATGWILAAGFWILAQILEVMVWKEHLATGVLKLNVLMPAVEELCELTGSCLFLLVTLALLESRRASRSPVPATSTAAPLRAVRDPASPAA